MKMMEALYNSDIGPDARVSQKNFKFAELINLRERNRKNLLASLNENEKETFEKFIDVQRELEDLAYYEKFSVGFKLGAMLMAEAFNGAEEIEE